MGSLPLVIKANGGLTQHYNFPRFHCLTRTVLKTTQEIVHVSIIIDHHFLNDNNILYTTY